MGRLCVVPPHRKICLIFYGVFLNSGFGVGLVGGGGGKWETQL